MDDDKIFWISYQPDGKYRGWCVVSRERSKPPYHEIHGIILIDRIPTEEYANGYLRRLNDAVEYWKEIGLV